MKANFIKLPGGHLVPATESDKEIVDKLKAGQVISVTFSRMRNYQFHKKYFALLNFAYDYWEPPELPDDPKKTWTKNLTPEKNFDRFRKDIIILAGYYDAYYRVDGSVRITAKSISFASMSEDEFEKLYSSTINVVIKQICTQYSAEELDSIVDQALAFA